MAETVAMSRRYFVMVYVGASSPEAVRSVGPFSSDDAASAWCEQDGIGHTPVTGEWASVIPEAPVEREGAE